MDETQEGLQHVIFRILIDINNGASRHYVLGSLDFHRTHDAIITSLLLQNDVATWF